MAEPLPVGFAGFAPKDPLLRMADMRANRTKVSSSTRVIKPGHPLISAANGTCDRCAVLGTSEVVDIDISNGGSAPTTGVFSFRVTDFGSVVLTSPTVPYNATIAQVQAAWDTMIGPGNVTVSLLDGTQWPVAGTTYRLTFKGKWASRNVGTITAVNNTMNNTGDISNVVSTAGVNGYVSSTTLIGFSTAYDVQGGEAYTYGREFAMPPLNLEGKFATDALSILFERLESSRRFIAAVDPFVALAVSHLDTACDIGWNIDTQQCYIAVGRTDNAIVKPVEILPDQLGLKGGLVEFVVVAANIGVV